ncbi:MAG: 2-C-methyl-D-erythritol 4-phosphate cytidylyltransferase [Bacteroidales bacterium]|nr:2-C-methyl-D-erythritol 4-phosphate cytidylyltransferase [Bacteroidales bacterium]MCF8403246.1 2-C-methyl-D-erythritol 4-phosphate cytidylyltransferase [Bacteroidales bacterium]
MKKYVIIVAGGLGSRMQSKTPKQFLQVAGKPILMHTLECFSGVFDDLEIILVLPAPYFDYWSSLCKRFDFDVDHTLVEGGENRFLSVKNGLRQINERGIVGVHDGVRPLLSKATIHNAFASAEINGNGIPVTSINESMRELKNDHNYPVARNNFRLIQTPQCFQSDLIIKAYKQEYREEFTDDATVVESLGIKIHLVDGNPENIKITSPSDIKIAQALLA